MDTSQRPQSVPELQQFLSGHNLPYSIVKVRTGVYKLDSKGKPTFLCKRIDDHTFEDYISIMSDDFL